MSRLTAFAKLIFVVCLPVLLLTANIRLAVSSTQLYEYGFDKYRVADASGMSNADLKRVAEGLVHYFNSSDDLFNITVTRYGQQTPLFHENEAVHFRDVKNIIRLDYAVLWATLCYSVVFAAAATILGKRRTGWRELLGAARWGSALTLSLMAALGVVVLVGFNQLFLAFHQTFFNNDLWIAQLGDVMTVLFPEDFFRDALVFIAAAMAIEAATILALTWIAIRKHDQSRKPVS
jgi:integral membrane protein (TIGR01906 family)